MSHDATPQPSPARTASASASSVVGLFAAPIELRRIVDELPLSVLITDPRRRIVLLNRQFEVLTGFPEEMVAGAPCWGVLRCCRCMSNCLSEEACDVQGPVTVKCDIINRERKKIPVTITSIPIYDAQGELSGFMETVMDEHLPDHTEDSVVSQVELGSFVGRSQQMDEVFRVVPVVAQTDSSVLITGETGTGKDLLAEIIHRNSERSEGPFIKINCGSLPETLLEAELFGHVKGAFTGAVSDKMGRFRLAHNGTVFLTEIGDLPLALQVKLLTFLDDKVIHPLGGAKGVHVDVRVIAATHRNLEQMVRDGSFRQDLLYRLNVVRLHLPPLRDREGDAPLLLEHFLKAFSARFSKPKVSFDEKSHSFLLHYFYPGNVRELRNIVEYAVNVCRADRISLEELPAYLFDEPKTAAPARTADQTHSGVGGFAAPPSSLESYASRPEKDFSNAASWPEAERRLIMDTLMACRGKRSDAAKRLGWSRSKLWRKMKHYRMDT